MTTTSTINTADIPAIDHREAMNLQTAELARAIAMLRSLNDEEWTAPTECPDWDVRKMWLHVLGACEAGASMRENMHQMRRARALKKSTGVALEAGLSATQVAERLDLTPADLIDRLEAIAPKTVRARSKMPGLVRKITIAVDAPIEERWSLGYLTDIIYLRDLWMHRIDTSRATARSLELTTEHDGRVVADVVAEWARRHDQPCTLELTGAAGGTFSAKTGGEMLAMDAVEFCRVLAGRGDASGLLATVVPF